MSIFSSFRRKPVETVIAALGNPGRKYENSRHNAGFLAAAYLLKEQGADIARARFSALTTELGFGEHRVLLLLPQTYMNESGRAVAEAMRFYKLPPERLIVLSDDIHLPCGMIRVRTHGSAGGHNGLKSIEDHLHSENFPRVRIGVGAPESAEDQVNWVLSDFSKAEQAQLREAFAEVSDAVGLLLDGKTEEAMNRYNHKK